MILIVYTSNLIHWIKEEISNTPQGTKQILIWFLRSKGESENFGSHIKWPFHSDGGYIKRKAEHIRNKHHSKYEKL